MGKPEVVLKVYVMQKYHAECDTAWKIVVFNGESAKLLNISLPDAFGERYIKERQARCICR